jgi:hypothetical protein
VLVLTFQQIHDHVVVLSLDLGVFIALVPGGPQPSLSARTLGNVNKLFEGICLELFINRVACDSAELIPGREMPFPMPNFGFLMSWCQRQVRVLTMSLKLTLNGPIDNFWYRGWC